MPDDLLAHWPLRTDARDQAGLCHGTATGVTFTAQGAHFSGRGCITMPRSLPLAAGPFTLSLWVHADSGVLDTLGDLVSQYDALSRTGFALSIKDNSAATSNTPNSRNLRFFVDAGTPSQWEHCGRPGDTHMIYALQVHAGALYAAGHEAPLDLRGHVYRYAGGAHWTDCGAPDQRHAVTSLASAGGDLFAATGFDDLRGTKLCVAKNPTPGGAIHRYLGDGRWEECPNPFADVAARSVPGGWNPAGRIVLANFGGTLHAANMHHPQVFRYEQGSWKLIAESDFGAIATAALNQHIYIASKGLRREFYPGRQRVRSPAETLIRFNGDGRAEPCGAGLDGQVYGITKFRGQLFAGTWPRGKTFRSATGINDWIDTGACGLSELDGEQKSEIMPMVEYHGQLYVGTLPLAEVYRYDGDQRWTQMARLDHTPNVAIRRVWTMAEFSGRLFCGTVPAGTVHALQVGHGVMDAHAFPTGWHHVAVVRAKHEMQLWIDDRCVATNAAPLLNLDTPLPLQLGMGPHGPFLGTLRDMRVFKSALAPAQIQALATMHPSALAV